MSIRLSLQNNFNKMLHKLEETIINWVCKLQIMPTEFMVRTCCKSLENQLRLLALWNFIMALYREHILETLLAPIFQWHLCASFGGGCLSWTIYSILEVCSTDFIISSSVKWYLQLLSLNVNGFLCPYGYI